MLFPVPIEPVRPMTRTAQAFEVGDDVSAELGIDGRPHAEPALETRHRLMQQHAKPVDDLQAIFAARPEGTGVMSGT